ncbi:MAG: TIGR03435 family protein [Candidatus Solibacter sp.]
MRLILLAMLLSLSAQAADFTGNWASAPMYLILTQDGAKLSGTGGPTAKDQQLSFNNGTVDGNRASFKIGSFQITLTLNSDELRGELNTGSGTQPIYLKRVVAGASPGPTHFDVASVKRATPPPGQSGNSSMQLAAGRVTMTNVSLKKLLYEAYQVKDYQISGPDWLASEIFDITATIPNGATRDGVLVMIQNLLAERFKVTLHREPKEMPVYALLVDKANSKLKEVEFGRSSTSLSKGALEGVAVPMRNLVEVLSRQMSRPVLDMTGLKGFYTFTMTYALDEAPAAPVDGVIPESSVGPSLARALQDQLGLRLEARRAPVDMLIVDHAEKVPVEN